jgi:hypothetical protein
VKRGAWLAGGAGTLAVGVTAAIAATSSGAAYAVTPHADGTLTVAISQPSGIAGANVTLTTLGDRVVVVPVRAGCPSIDSLPTPVSKGGEVQVSGSLKQATGSITVDAHGIPDGDVLILAADETGHGIAIDARLTASPAPSCVSEPSYIPGSGKVSGTGSDSGQRSLTPPPGGSGPQGVKGTSAG